MKTIALDFSSLKTREEVHGYLKKKFGFPDYYGCNLDALADCLSDAAEDVEIEFLEDEAGTCCEAVEDAGAGQSEEILRYLKSVRRVIEDAAEENSRLHL